MSKTCQESWRLFEPCDFQTKVFWEHLGYRELEASGCLAPQVQRTRAIDGWMHRRGTRWRITETTFYLGMTSTSEMAHWTSGGHCQLCFSVLNYGRLSPHHGSLWELALCLKSRNEFVPDPTICFSRYYYFWVHGCVIKVLIYLIS